MPRQYINLISSEEEDEKVVGVPIIDLTSDDDQVFSNTSSYHSNRTLHRVIHHSIQKRSLSTRSVVALPQNCRECTYDFTNDNDEQPLSQRKSFNLCAGCSLLNANINVTKEDPTTVKHWLCTGELSKEDWDDNTAGNEAFRIARCADRMRGRFERVENGRKKNPRYEQGLPSDEALMQRYVDSDCKCAITGWVCHFGYHCEKSWSVSFDHVIPISDAPPGFNSWVSSNIQITCNLLNKIKGSLSDAEVRRWFKIWRDANIINY